MMVATGHLQQPLGGPRLQRGRQSWGRTRQEASESQEWVSPTRYLVGSEGAPTPGHSHSHPAGAPGRHSCALGDPESPLSLLVRKCLLLFSGHSPLPALGGQQSSGRARALLQTSCVCTDTRAPCHLSLLQTLGTNQRGRKARGC